MWGLNSVEWASAFFGCVLRGVIAVPLDAAGSAKFAKRVIAQLIMARRADLHPKAEYICADLSSLPNFPLQSCGGPYIPVTYTDVRSAWIIAHGRLAEVPLVLTIELAGALIPYFEGCTRGIQFSREHLLTRCVKPKLFLKLERTQGREAAEVMVQGRSPHPGHRCKIIYVQCLLVVLTQPIDRLCCSMVFVATERRRSPCVP